MMMMMPMPSRPPAHPGLRDGVSRLSGRIGLFYACGLSFLLRVQFLVTMRCPRCAKENEEGAKFCSRCGIEMGLVAQPTVGGDTRFCYKHPKRETNLSCGRCDKPLCTDCVILGAAGPRCKECAKSDVTFRPAAVVLEAKRGVRSITKLGPWGIYILVIVAITLIGWLGRGCSSQRAEPGLGPDGEVYEQFDEE